MTALPDGWRGLSLSEVLAEPLMNGRSVPTREGGFPVLRLTAIRDGRVELTERKPGAWSAADAAPYAVSEGDVLVVRGNGSLSLVGRAALVGEVANPVAFPDTIIRIRPSPDVMDARYLTHLWNSPDVRKQLEAAARTTAGIYKVNQKHLGSVTLVVPPLHEQLRIVDSIEDHLSRLDAAREYLAASKRRLAVAHRAILSTIVPDVASYPPKWESSTVGDAGLVELGRQRHPDWHTGSNVLPYLRVANVFEDDIRIGDLKEMHWPGETFERFKVHPGDILLNEGQTPDLLGRPALYRGGLPEVAFTNSLIRFRAREGILPEWALLVFRRHMHAKRFKRESRITTNIAHLSAARLKAVEFPIPSLAEQHALVAQADELLEANRRVREGIAYAEARSEALRRAVLSAAFSGQLTGRASDRDRVEELVGAGSAL